VLHWSDIRGQERPLDILRTALETGRVHHAYLFSGLEGVGKFSTAHTFAAIVNCEQRSDDTFEDACGQCSSCRKIAQRQHPDILFVEPEKDRIKIAQIRDIQKASSRAPHEAKYRIVLIDEAHTMTEEASNALLKTLEEPSARMRLILVTDQPHRLLETIISRCQVLRFGGLLKEDVVDLLDRVLEQNGTLDEPLADKLMSVAAGYGEGSVGRSVAIVESGMLADRREFIESVLNLPRGETVALLDLAKELSSDKSELDNRLDVLKLFFRDVMLFKTNPTLYKTTPEQKLVNWDLVDLVASYAEEVSMDDLFELIDEIREAQYLMMRNVNRQLITEDLLGSFRRRGAAS
jgi:DNA polymerase-3 subunit delta'